MNVQQLIQERRRRDLARLQAVRELSATGGTGEAQREAHFIEQEREEEEGHRVARVVVVQQNYQAAQPPQQARGGYAAVVVGRALAAAGVRVAQKARAKK